MNARFSYSFFPIVDRGGMRGGSGNGGGSGGGGGWGDVAGSDDGSSGAGAFFLNVAAAPFYDSCGCDSDFQPICDLKTGSNFYSPCLAGCRAFDAETGDAVGM